MTSPIFGIVHSPQRYVTFGIVAGIAAAVVSVVSGIDLEIASPIAAAIAALGAGSARSVTPTGGAPA